MTPGWPKARRPQRCAAARRSSTATPGWAKPSVPRGALDGSLGLVAVATDLLDQRLDAVEPHLAAQPGDEPHLGGLAVEVAVEVEQVGLEQAGVGLLVERGTAPERDGAGVHRSVGALVPAGVDAVGGQEDVAGHRHVGGGEPELAAPVVAVGHDARAPRGDGRAARWRRRGRPRPGRGGSRWSWPSAASPAGSPVGVDQREALDLEAEVGAHLRAAGRRCPRRWWPKWKSSPTITTLAPRQSTSTSCTNSSAGSLDRASSKVITRQRSTPGGREQLELLVEVGEQAGRRLGPHHRGRVAVEGDDGGLHARRLAARGPHLGDHGLVPEVHAVVGADRDDGAGVGSRAAPDVVQHLHRARSVTRRLGFASTTDGFTVRAAWARRRRGARRPRPDRHGPSPGDAERARVEHLAVGDGGGDRRRRP